MMRWLRHQIRTRNHHHEFVMHAFKLPRPEGGTYYQFKCTKCSRRKGDRRFKPQQIMSPSVLFTVRVPLDLMPTLEHRADERSEAPSSYIDRLVKRELMSR